MSPTTKWLIPDVEFSQDLSAAALSFTTTIGRAFRLTEITLSASENITETITITRDSAKGSAYDVILRKRGLSAEKNFVFRPDGDADFQAGDELKVQCTDANSLGTVSGLVKAKELYE